ncbi:MAG: hypothetical protein E7290_01850 [Lachnospiraceae bacterium]|nr:hypothetical protein [Lachnospiraceae bacterium]
MNNNIENTLKWMKHHLNEADNIVAVLGIEMVLEGGGKALLDNEETYRVEDEYGYAPEEMLTGAFYSAKREKFYQFYKKEIASMQVNPTATHDALKQLQDKGKLKAIINTNYHEVPKYMGLNNIINLHGSLNENHCTKCHKMFNNSYMIKSEGVSLCDECQSPIRPGIRLIDERVNDEVLTRAVHALERADMVLYLGWIFTDEEIKYKTDRYVTQKRMAIGHNPSAVRAKLDFAVKGEVNKILPRLL